MLKKLMMATGLAKASPAASSTTNAERSPAAPADAGVFTFEVSPCLNSPVDTRDRGTLRESLESRIDDVEAYLEFLEGL